MSSLITIDKRLIGQGHATFIIAEIAQAHEGSLGLAHSFIDAAASIGANAVKFQTHIAESESSPQEPWRIPLRTQDASRFDYWRRMEFSLTQWKELAEHARQKGLIFLSSPFSTEAVDLLCEIGMPAWKIGSGELLNPLLLERLCETRAPLLLSTGLCNWNDLDRSINLIRATNPFAILQCTSLYPCPPEKLGLHLIAQLQSRYGVPVGFSDHSAHPAAGLAAVTLGAHILEFHLTFSREMFGPDASSSLTVDEAKILVNSIRWLEKALIANQSKEEISAEITTTRDIFTKGLVAAVDLSEGMTIERQHLSARKPNLGISVNRYKELVGRKLTLNKKKGDFFHINDISPPAL